MENKQYHTFEGFEILPLGIREWGEGWVQKSPNLRDIIHAKITSLTLSWKYPHIVTQFLLTSSSMSMSSKNFVATFSKASAGHSVNQSNVQQFTKDGNILEESGIELL